MTVTPDASDNGLREATQGLRDDLEEAGIETSAPDAELGDAGQGPIVSLLAAGDEDDPQAANLVVSGFPDQPECDGPPRLLLRNAFEANAGVVLVPPRPPDHDGESPEVALWVRAEGPRWHLERNLPHSDLALLLAYRIAESWNAKLALVTAVARPEDASAAEQYLDEIVERARLPGPPAIHVITTPFAAALEEAPSATLHVLALSSQTDFDWLREVRERLDTPCIFVRDSGVENAFA